MGLALNEEFLSKVKGRVRTSCTMGGDPEFFVAEAVNGTILNSDRFFPGKDEPIVIKSCGETVTSINAPNKLYFDGIQAEMGFSHSTCREDISKNIRLVMRHIAEKIGTAHKVVISPAVKVKKSIIDNAHPEARIFGCMPDYNAYTLTTNTPQMDASSHLYRYAGGHIHLGWSSPYLGKDDPEYKMVKEPENHLRIIRFLDLLVSLVTLPLDNAPGSKQRRDKYGKAGCFRPTPYGVEYRTPSCWWLGSAATTSLVMGLARMAWNLIAWGVDEEFREVVEAPDEDVRGIINSGDTKESYKMWKRMRPYLAMVGEVSNPLHINCVAARNCTYSTDYALFKSPLKRGEGVSALAAFEYVIKNGLDTLRNPDPLQEWTVDCKADGFTWAAFNRLFINNDFMKFQEEFLEKTLMEA